MYKVIGSKFMEAKKRVFASCSRVVCLRLKDNLVIVVMFGEDLEYEMFIDPAVTL